MIRRLIICLVIASAALAPDLEEAEAGFPCGNANGKRTPQQRLRHY